MNTKSRQGEFKVGDRVRRTKPGEDVGGIVVGPKVGDTGAVREIDESGMVEVEWDTKPVGGHSSTLWAAPGRIERIEESKKARAAKPYTVTLRRHDGIKSLTVNVDEVNSLWVSYKGYRLNLFDIGKAGLDITVWTPGQGGKPVDWIDMLISGDQFTARAHQCHEGDEPSTVTGDAIIPAKPVSDRSDSEVFDVAQSRLDDGVEIGNLTTEFIEGWLRDSTGSPMDGVRNPSEVLDRIEEYGVERKQMWDEEVCGEHINNTTMAAIGSEIKIGDYVRVKSSSVASFVKTRRGLVIGYHNYSPEFVLIGFDGSDLPVLHSGVGCTADGTGKTIDCPDKFVGKSYFVARGELDKVN